MPPEIRVESREHLALSIGAGIKSDLKILAISISFHLATYSTTPPSIILEVTVRTIRTTAGPGFTTRGLLVIEGSPHR
jgi:hypothetical protein